MSFVCILLLAQPPNQICATAVWNSSYSITAGATSSYSTAANRLNSPMDVFIDGNGYMYVVDYGNNRIQYFPPGSLSFSCDFLNYRSVECRID
jgi:hypothetical protein